MQTVVDPDPLPSELSGSTLAPYPKPFGGRSGELSGLLWHLGEMSRGASIPDIGLGLVEEGDRSYVVQLEADVKTGLHLPERHSDSLTMKPGIWLWLLQQRLDERCPCCIYLVIRLVRIVAVV